MKDTFPRLLVDDPEGSDRLESGSHKRIAESIYRCIQQAPDNLRLIGLEGKWGSGKSNVIKIVEKLDQDDHFFYYDAWAHQEDLQRRSFLEDFTEMLNADLLKDKGWSKKLANLLAHKKTSIKKTIPQLSPGIIASLLVVLLTPLFHFIASLFTQLQIQLLISLIPLGTALMTWLAYSLIKWKRLQLSSLFYIYQNKELEEITDETISENEPSVREFKAWMKAVNDDLKKIDKKVVVVFDNMDRLPVDKVKTLWASIHTFFSEEKFSQIFVLVPFDRQQISLAFEQSNEAGRAEQFITKTFTVVFRVPPPVLTDWKLFFRQIFTEAFDHEEITEFPYVINLFEAHQVSGTPRAIISFINELVILKMVWQEEIQLRYMALYVLKCQEGLLENPLKEILSPHLLSRAMKILVGDKTVVDHIAALVYGVPVKHAAQVNLGQEIQQLFQDGKKEELVALAKDAHFFILLENIEPAALDSNLAVKTLGFLQAALNENGDLEIMQRVWHSLLSHRLTLPQQELEFSEVHQLLLANCALDLQKEFLAFLLNGYPQIGNFSGSGFYGVLQQIDTFITTQNIGLSLKSLVTSANIKPEPAVYADYVKTAKEAYRQFELEVDFLMLENHLISQIKEGCKDGEILLYLKKEYPFTRFLEQLKEGFEANTISLDHIHFLHGLYERLTQQTLLVPLLANEDKKYKFWTSSISIPSERFYEMVAIRFVLGRQCTKEWLALIEEETNLIKNFNEEEVLDRIEKYINPGELLVKSNRGLNTQFKELLIKMIIRGVRKKLDYNLVIPHLKAICERLSIGEEDMLDFLKQYSNWADGKAGNQEVWDRLIAEAKNAEYIS